jgi:hypothetical protein
MLQDKKSPPSPRLRRDSPESFGTGGKGIRTPGLLIANETLYQLSYTPGQKSENITAWRFVSNRKNTARAISSALASMRQKVGLHLADHIVDDF